MLEPCLEDTMVLPVEKLEAAAMELSVQDRAYLAQRLLVSLHEETEYDPTAVEAWHEELRRRVESIENGTAELIPAEEVMADYWARRRK